MKIERLRMKNYIGIYNGLGKDEITIDFSKCKHKIILLKGDNGSGKSTIMSAASPLPDENSSFIPKEQAEKELIITDNGMIYNILFIHAVKSNDTRDTTKAYIRRGLTELNPNGNVTSFKDILYSEFNLDPNFIALSKLSGDDRGLADKTPAERKKFVTSIIDTLSVYNDIFKTLSKRSTVFKSMINNIVTKLDAIGDENKVKMLLTSLENRIDDLVSNKNKCIEEIAANKSMISLMDPNSTIQDTYERIYREITSNNSEKESIELKIQNEIIKTSLNINSDNIMVIYSDAKNSINDLATNIQIMESTISNLLSTQENNSSNLRNKIERLNALKDEDEFDNIETALNECKKNISDYEEMFKKYNITNVLNLTRDEYISGLNVLRDIKDSIDVLKSNAYFESIQKAILCIENNVDLVSELSIAEDAIYGLEENIKNDIEAHATYSNLLNISSKLDQRPSNCKIDDCPFIKDAIDAFNQSPEHNKNSLEISINDNTVILEELKLNKQRLVDTLEIVNNIRIILRTINNYSPILNKLPNGNIFTDRDTLLKRIKNSDAFEDIENLYKFIQYSNIIDLYKEEKNKLIRLTANYDVYKSKGKIVDEIMNDIDILNTNADNIIKEINNNQDALKNNKIQLSKFKSLEIQLDAIITLYNNRDKMNKSIDELKIQYNGIRHDILKIRTNLESIERFSETINNINSELSPIMEDRDRIKHNLILLGEYRVELEEYNNKYEKVEAIKYYSSPNTGIQTIFMELYMNKIISLANELLSYLFNGEFVLEPFIINEKEFRIPCKGSGFRNDDISSMSTSQICMISMILSFAILMQSSTKYNILRLDEIDGGLSTMNRVYFLEVLNKQIDVLNVEQCLMTSHNNEINFADVDIILLKCSDYEQIREGNIIFDANL